jgi:hypothetical protein
MQNNKKLKPTCPLKLGNLCDERCALCLVHEDDEKDTICAITVLALSVQEIAGGFADE